MNLSGCRKIDELQIIAVFRCAKIKVAKIKGAKNKWNYKDTGTSISVDKRSNQPKMRKRAIIKGFVDIARSLYDQSNDIKEPGD